MENDQNKVVASTSISMAISEQNGFQCQNGDKLEEGIKWILCISGKRKSGKDFVTRHLVELLRKKFPNFSVSICILSEPLKEEFAKLNGLDATALMSDGQAKEAVRKEMIEFGERQRAKNSTIFCRKAMKRRKRIEPEQFHQTVQNGEECAKQEIVLVSDCRRPTDIQFFKKLPNEMAIAIQVLCIRVDSSLEARIRREFIFKKGVDDAESECALDEFGEWDFRIENDRDDEEAIELEAKLMEILQRLERGSEHHSLNI